MKLSTITCNTCESQSQDQDSPVPELSATTITFSTCESQSQDQDSPVPELSATTIVNRLVLHLCHKLCIGNLELSINHLLTNQQ